MYMLGMGVGFLAFSELCRYEFAENGFSGISLFFSSFSFSLLILPYSVSRCAQRGGCGISPSLLYF